MVFKSSNTDKKNQTVSSLQNSITRLHDLLTQIINTSPRRIVVIADSTIVHANPALLAELGYPLKQLVGSHLSGIIALAKGGDFLAKYLSMEASYKKHYFNKEPVMGIKSNGKQTPYTARLHHCLWHNEPALLLVLDTYIGLNQVTNSALASQKQAQYRSLQSAKVYYWDYKFETEELCLDPDFFINLNLSIDSQDLDINTWLTLLSHESQQEFAQLVAKAKARKKTHFQWAYSLSAHRHTPVTFFANIDVVEWNNLGNPSRIAGVHIRLNTDSYSNHVTTSSTKTLKGLISNMIEGLMIIDRQGFIREWNPAQEKITRIKRSEAVGKYVWVLQQSLCDQNRPCNKYIDKLYSFFKSIPQTSKDSLNGKVFDLWLNVGSRVCKLVQHTVFTIDTNSHSDFVVAVTTKDITEVRQNLQDIERSEERLRIALAYSKVGIWDIDTISGHSYFSPMMYAIFGYRPYQVEPSLELLSKHVHPCDLDLVNENLKSLTIASANSHFEFRANRTDGQAIWVECKAHVVKDERNRTVRIMGTLSDISRQKNIENTLRTHQQELTKALEQQQVVAQIAYELNSNTNFDKKINYALHEIGNLTNASRVYIFENSADGTTTTNIYEWCKDGVKPQIQNQQNESLQFTEQWLGSGYMQMSNSIEQDLPHNLAQNLLRQDIQSILVFRLLVNSNNFGFIGLDECSYHRVWTQAEQDFLKTIANLLAFAFYRRVAS